MKITFIMLFVLLHAAAALGQASGSAVDVVTVYSQNEKYYLKSVPYDDEYPTLRGKSSVYEVGTDTPLYSFDRGFDSIDKYSNNLILSNDGEVIFYVITWSANEEKEGLKSITIYRHGRIIKSFTEAELTGCDKKQERCGLVYSNYDDVVDREKSHVGSADYKKVLKAGVDEKEKFLSDFAIFSHDDTVYLTDSKKQVHLFDLKEGRLIQSDSFDHLVPQFEELVNEALTE